MKRFFSKIKTVKGELNFAGDKSISHRAIFFSSMAEGKSLIKNISLSEDVKSTKNIFSQLGVKFLEDESGLIVEGKGKRKFIPPANALDCGNSGTTARLLSGLLIAQDFSSVIIGDESLSKRPMKRIIEPLRQMGGNLESINFNLPIKIFPADSLNSIEYQLPVASAQVKSAILIAGLHLSEKTKVIEKFITRDHTERMLGLPVIKSDNLIVISSSEKFYPTEKDYFIPGDVSSSAFFIVLALLSKNSELVIKDVSLNPTRTGFLDILKKMNADIKIENEKQSSNEPYGDIIVHSSDLKNITVDSSIIPNIIDEIPILSVAGVFAEGNFEIRNCEELRYKESDRIKAICENLKLTGLEVEEFTDGFRISGKIKNAQVNFNSFNDHRIAMAFSVLSMLIGNECSVEGIECVGISNPNFYEQMEAIKN
ncbi:3-phosphoshikimate 1-carboxyvinyltransferase [Ignavibacterium album JCM 16511]|uniref:3-phosphoshikimate 1-carboxyvinyltransferase n=1 Tax=Ignavibacterium album (strain DSM 19864 / JCM 16511 / NBRC 101810 / Mat9-16) TaxID=945713 RepID=I0AKK4_IGNAJ|nr:3-phosphoshikimate 1-carboxyvinyltransferase [Ignavibacterium album]AFH49511.1 3-phosphoshikimate 1-carboxyvinyltransferase [Ignavibacterium album JCM 16511]